MEEKPNNLLEARKSAGLSRSKAAEELKVDPKTLYRYENGTQCPNVYMAIRLSEYYHRTIKELFPSKDGI
ncbi:MAG: helix-turn-helix transcriptional regulator [Eubacterium sp.]